MTRINPADRTPTASTVSVLVGASAVARLRRWETWPFPPADFALKEWEQ